MVFQLLIIVFLVGCVGEYFGNDVEESKEALQGCKCILGSKESEESLAEFAAWEPPHGKFRFLHPWKNYLEIGASSVSCACCIDTLAGYLDSKNQVPESLKAHLRSACTNLSSSSSQVIRELATITCTMTRSAYMHTAVEEMKDAVKELQNELSSLVGLLIQPHDKEQEQQSTMPHTLEEKELAPNEITIMHVMPLLTFASLLIQTASSIEENMVKSVKELANAAKFKQPENEMQATRVSGLESMTALEQV